MANDPNISYGTVYAMHPKTEIPNYGITSLLVTNKRLSKTYLFM